LNRLGATIEEIEHECGFIDSVRALDHDNAVGAGHSRRADRIAKGGTIGKVQRRAGHLQELDDLDIGNHFELRHCPDKFGCAQRRHHAALFAPGHGDGAARGNDPDFRLH
jgi:hypothetical protein